MMQRIALAVCVIALVLNPTANAELKLAKDAFTSDGYYDALLEFNRRTSVEPYKLIGKHDPKWDDDAVAVLDGMALLQSSGRAHSVRHFADKSPSETLLKQAAAARAKGCDDPLVGYAYGWMLINVNRGVEAQPIFEAAANELMDSRYPVVRAVYAARRQYLTAPDAKARDAAWTKLRDLCVTFMGGELKNIDRRIVWDELEEFFADLPHDRLHDLNTAAHEVKASDPWLAGMLNGLNELTAGWEARGTDPAKKPTASGLKQFHEHLTKARDALTAAWKLHPDYPEAATEMITVAMGDKELGEDPRAWFDRAVAAQCDWPEAYRNYSFVLLPRSGGSTQKMYDFGVECLDTARFDTYIPFQFMLQLQQIAWDQQQPQIWSAAGTYDNVKRMCDGYEQSPEARDHADYYRSTNAAAAWRANHFDDARKLLDALGEHLDGDAFKRVRVIPAIAVSHVYAMTGSSASVVESAEKLADAKNLDAAIDGYKAAVQNIKEGDKAGFFLKSRLRQLQWEKEFAGGEWVNIQPDAEMVGWGALAGEWKVADGALVGKATKGLSIAFIGTFLAPRAQIEATFELADVPQPQFAGIFISPTDPYADKGTWLYQSGGKTELYNSWTGRKGAAVPAGTKHTLRLSVWDDKIYATVDDKSMFHFKQTATSDRGSKLYVTFGAAGNIAGTEIRITNLRVRLSKQEPTHG